MMVDARWPAPTAQRAADGGAGGADAGGPRGGRRAQHIPDRAAAGGLMAPHPRPPRRPRAGGIVA
ncbi:hypothetical protein I553_3803 [Mycobacterium xenopi 4042]|uniref:Uncharacterized protein n=1 Tax=Mycobacterium xenopi 4042 TaxID=1299334 RepID=X8EYB7_MYCXE|nr:hypothetical protein I553_3803 [Mycobacterium xenopi 4042]